MGKQHTIEQMAEALTMSHGYVSAAAQILELTPAAIYKRIKENKKLRDLLKEIAESKLDIAENKLVTAVNNGEPWAIKYLLENKGRERGYGKQVIEQTVKDERPDPHKKYRDMTPEQRQKRLAELRARQEAA